MQALNLPAYAHRTKKIDDKIYIFDVIRKKYFVLTPEEWVRQHFIHLLLSHYNYSKSLIRLEKGLSYNKLQKRTDIVVLDQEGKPFLFVECKAPEITINQKVVEQASRYNLTVRCPFVVVTNGMHTFCFKIDFTTHKYEQLNDLPTMNKS